MKNINSGQPKKKLDVLREGPFEITEKTSNTDYRLNLPVSWKIHKSFHVSKLRRVKPDEFNRQPPRVTLHVRGKNWNASEITKAKLLNGRLEYLVRWTLPDGQVEYLGMIIGNGWTPRKSKQSPDGLPRTLSKMSNNF